MVCPERVPERTAEQVDVPVSEDVEQTTCMPVLVNGGRVTAAGGDAGYVKKLIVNDRLSSVNRVASEILFQPLHPETGISLHDEHVNTLHEEARKVGSRGHIDERFMEERRRRIFKEYTKLQNLQVQEAKNLVAGADLFHLCRVGDGVGGLLPADERVRL